MAYGECQCGCGEKTNLAPYSRKSKGWISGQPLKRIAGHSRREPRLPIQQPKSHKIIALTSGAVTLVPNDKYDMLMQQYWHLSSAGYAVCTRWGKEKKLTYLHRLVMDAPKGVEVDHINRDPLDNRRENLRLCSHSQNGANKLPPASKSGYKNVYKTYETRWQVKAKVKGKITYFGSYRSLKEAVIKSNEVLIELHGEFATLNSLEGL